MQRQYAAPLAGCILFAAAAFLPWLRIGDVGLPGVPDPAGYFVIALGIAGVLLSLVGMFTGRNLHQMLVLVGLAALTTLIVVWRIGPSTIADRAQARAEAIAIVDNVAAQPVPPVRVGAGLLIGLAGALTTAGAGLARTFRNREG